MGFSQSIRDEVFVAAARHCCVCHLYKGLNLEVHHITPKADGGEDTIDNAIVLCFDCHSNAGHYFAGHPKGSKLSPTELKKHKEAWFEIVLKNKIQMPVNQNVELTFSGNLQPVFIEETTIFRDKNALKEVDYKSLVKQMKTGSFYSDHWIDKIKTFEDYVNFINGDDIEKYTNDPQKENDPQPVVFSLDMFGSNPNKFNLSVCTLKLKLTNYGPDVLEDYKLYLNFENAPRAEVVDKRENYLDLYQYKYTMHFKDNFNAEFIPEISVLVQNDSISLDDICFKTTNQPTTVFINWKIVARGFSKTEKIELNILPINEIKEASKFVDYPTSIRSSKKVITKYVREKDQKLNTV